MGLRTLLARSREASRLVRRDLAAFARYNLRPVKLELTNREQYYLSELRRNGFAVVDGYWPRDEALRVRDQLQAHLREGKSREFECGAYLRVWHNRAWDDGVSRIYHVERLGEELKKFRNDPFM